MRAPAQGSADGPVLELRDLTIHYGDTLAIDRVTLDIPTGELTAFIGPSGCGKSTLLRSFNRLIDLVPGVRVDGRLAFHGADVYGPDADARAHDDPVPLRRRIGMVFQRPNVFPLSIYENVAYGPRVNQLPASRSRADLDDLVQDCLQRAGLWAELQGDLNASAHELSGGQQQRLVIARCLAVGPEVLLMDEPTSSLDPIATARIEELMLALLDDHTIVLVTHDLQQAVRVAGRTAFFSGEPDASGTRSRAPRRGRADERGVRQPRRPAHPGLPLGSRPLTWRERGPLVP